jgi:adenylate kinase
LRDYMQQHIVPTVTDALIEVCKVMPEDPVDYIAEYLFARSDEAPAMPSDK